MSDTACNFTHHTRYNPSRDIIWSFKVCLCAANLNASGGFATYVTTASEISGGGIGSGLGYMPYNTTDGVSGNLVVVGFDNLGYFSLQGINSSTGILTPILNSCGIRTGETYQYKALAPLPFNLLKTTEEYTTLRFVLTDVGQTLNIYYLNTEERYSLISSVSTGVVAGLDWSAKVGVSYSSPVNLGDQKTVLRVKDLHVQGLQIF